MDIDRSTASTPFALEPGNEKMGHGQDQLSFALSPRSPKVRNDAPLGVLQAELDLEKTPQVGDCAPVL